MPDLGHTTTARPSDARDGLVERLRQGDDGAFEEVVRTHSGQFLAVCRRLLGNEEDAREAVQDAFLSAFRALDRFTGQAQLSTWLYRIVVNSALMKRRSRRRHPEASIEDLLPRFDDHGHHVEPPATWQPVDDDLLRVETRELVRRMIDRLPESHRTVLLLRDIQEHDTCQTALILGITENAVKIRLHRARQALRTLLDGHMRNPT